MQWRIWWATHLPATDREKKDEERLKREVTIMAELAEWRGVVNSKDSLKVHKNENFFGFDFEFYIVSLLVMFKY
jgi:hypothetical protein